MTIIVGLSFLLTNCLLSLLPQINKPTRITHDCYSIIDNIFTNVLHNKVQCCMLIDDTSDHLPVFCITCHEVKRKKKFSL